MQNGTERGEGGIWLVVAEKSSLSNATRDMTAGNLLKAKKCAEILPDSEESPKIKLTIDIPATISRPLKHS